MKTNRKTIWMAAAIVAAIALAWWYYASKTNGVAYQTAAAEQGSIQASISATGNTNAVVTVQVGSQVSGNILALYADFNTKVKKGQLVAQIDPGPFQARADQARAAVDSARAMVVSAQA